MVSSRKKQVRREQESNDDKEVCGKPRQMPPPAEESGGSEAETARMTTGTIARPGQRRGGEFLRPAAKHGLNSRPHLKRMDYSPGRKDDRYQRRCGLRRLWSKAPRALSAARSLDENDSFAACFFGESLFFFLLCEVSSLLSCAVWSPNQGSLRVSTWRKNMRTMKRSEQEERDKNVVTRVMHSSSLFRRSYNGKKQFSCEAFLLNIHCLQPRAIALIEIKTQRNAARKSGNVH